MSCQLWIANWLFPEQRELNLKIDMVVVNPGLPGLTELIGCKVQNGSSKLSPSATGVFKSFPRFR
jgi:hypothetical protein